MSAGLRREAPASTIHLCVDMQRMFVEDTPWRAPWAERVLPVIVDLCARRPDRVIFTRFAPPVRAEAARGAWRDYWERWRCMTQAALPPEFIDLAAPLQPFARTAPVFDKSVYSPWGDGRLDAELRRRGADTLIVTGVETDVCVLATVMGAVDLGYRVLLPTDAVCGSADETHDKMMDVYASRFDLQVETTDSRELIHAWR